MRRVLAALCASALLGAACVGGDGTSAPSDSGDLPTTTQGPVATAASPIATTAPLAGSTGAVPVRGGSLVIAADQEPLTLNPYAPGGDNLLVAIIGQAHLAGASDIDATTLDLIPELVVDLPSVGNGGVSVNDDGSMTVEWQIRDEAVWSDGVPITGDDFAFTLEFREAMNDCRPDDGDLGPVPFQLGGEIETVDDKTIAIRFDQPGLQYEQLFEWVVPRHAVIGSDYCQDWNDTMWPSAGPFVVEEWQRGEFIRLVRNDEYWKVDTATGTQLPYLDSVEFRFTESPLDAFRAREADAIQPAPSPETVSELELLVPAGADVQVLPGPVWEHLNFQFGSENRNPESLNEYTTFRQAVAYAIDSEVLASAVGWLPIYSITDTTDEEGPWAQYEVDVAKAEALLAEACEMAGRDCLETPPHLIFTTTNNTGDELPRIADELVAMLGKVGIEVELQLEDVQFYFGETLQGGTWDVGWKTGVLSPGARGAIASLDQFDPNAPPPDGTNHSRWGTSDSSVQDESVERFREILEIVHGTVDSAEIKSLVAAAEQILAGNAVTVPVAAHRVVGAVWADEIAGFQMNATRAGHTWNIESWYRVDL